MKKQAINFLVLILSALILSGSELYGQTGTTGPVEEINKWAAEQTKNFDADDVVDFLNGGKAYSDITFGSEHAFSFEYTVYISATAMNATQFVVAYSDDDLHGNAIVGTISGLNISYGSAYVFNAAITKHNSIQRYYFTTYQ